ncbi:hypothetical protein EY643_15295 [Halioglobus maricola]|uniref:Uncharacterized protein n=1 Tax=Halioglobus maricola TaxID=2601894 RepID=A0A5P9NN63_9GAMM|nr:hypothetical protein [Halioglobus maricola]QFU76905.1 hypothetical protein EY643_15295 [Halioglobus maricola]
MGDKAIFESRDVSAPFSGKADEARKYVGEERRRDTRRSGEDRRDAVRFGEGVKPERRQTAGRREDDLSLQFW